MSNVLVTGGAGFIGSHVVDRLVADGHEVHILDNFSTGTRENCNKRAHIHEADITDFNSIEPYFAGVDTVFHLAALARIQPSIEDPLPSHEADVTGTLHVLWAAKKHGVGKVVYSASSSVYGDQPSLPLTENMEPHPKNPYAVQKFMGEMYCNIFTELYGLKTVCLRYFNVYGPRQLVDGAYATVIGIFLEQRAAGVPLTIVGTGEKRRDFTHVRDVVEANMRAWQHETPPRAVINIGTARNYSINELAELIGGERVHVADRPGESKETLADIRVANQLLDWSPRITLEEGILELKKLHNLL